MDDELTPEQKFAAEDPETMVPKALAQGRSHEDIVAELMRLDWSPEVASALVSRIENDLERYRRSPESRRDLVREARKEVAAGALLVLVALMFFAVTLLGAMAGAFPFAIIAIGMILTGFVLAGRGLARWRLYRGTMLPFDHDSAE
jgi:hypothetical protein